MASFRIVCALAGAAFVATASAAGAQTWPSRPIQVISPFSAGNATDIVARVVLDQISRQFGQSFVIENRPGGGGILGAATVAKAEPDGYTILLSSSSMSSQVVLHTTLPFDTVHDFTPVVMFRIQPNGLVTGPSKGWKSVGDLIAAAKAKPGELNFASAAVGAASRMAGAGLPLPSDLEGNPHPIPAAEQG